MGMAFDTSGLGDTTTNLSADQSFRSPIETGSSSGNDELQCKLCGKHFSTRQSLQRHSVIHTGEKPFSCHICQRRFNQKSNLRTHLVVHMKI
ncbi:early growth response protein 1-like isoform X7 [Dreissena polymorpha]|uniref:early growth response protein 1-like isoform X7 n=1 Tax=Dreissena polymorpha TaxID=45954 RepID=UPI002263ECAF|nr:early growth response protein 1-like isoform X7 [Dreissena polymorpha]